MLSADILLIAAACTYNNPQASIVEQFFYIVMLY